MSKISEFMSPNIAKNLEKELLTILGDDLKKADTALYQRATLKFRDIVDNNFPTLLIVDYSSIKAELKQYQDIDTALKTYINETYNPTARDYTSKLSDTEVDMLVSAIRHGMKSFSSTVTPILYTELQAKLSNILDNQSGDSSTVYQVRNLFSKVYKLLGVPGSNAEIFIFPNFANLGGLLKRHLDVGLDIAEHEAEVGHRSATDIGKVLAFGHTAAGYINSAGDAVLKFNSPKSLQIMFEVMKSASDKAPSAAQAAVQAVTSFVTDTRQIEIFITVDKDFSDGFLRLFVRAGGNIVKFENSLINSRRGTVLESKEKRGQNKKVLELLSAAFAKADTTLSKRLARYVFTHKASPNVLEYVQHALVSSLKGIVPQKYNSKSTVSKNTKDTIKKQVISGIAKKTKAKIPVLSKVSTKVPKTQNQVSLASLQLLINAQLQHVISANMGDGNSRNILNYRTGRLAGSAQVERLTQSREGMITAFYSYMKNPYATFSEGGRQQSPRTRDPKLLISNSIRQIAATMVTNRLRAVVV